MSKRLKAPPRPDFTFVRGRCGRDAIRIDLPSGGIGIVATTISRGALSAFAASLRRKIAKRTRLARAAGPASPIDAGGKNIGVNGVASSALVSATFRTKQQAFIMANTVVRLEITGQVQGVGFRWSMAEQAGRLGVRGWVRNRRDGSVEAMVAGDSASVDQLIVWARKGPPTAAVEAVKVIADDTETEFESFEQRSTV